MPARVARQASAMHVITNPMQEQRVQNAKKEKYKKSENSPKKSENDILLILPNSYKVYTKEIQL